MLLLYDTETNNMGIKLSKDGKTLSQKNVILTFLNKYKWFKDLDENDVVYSNILILTYIPRADVKFFSSNDTCFNALEKTFLNVLENNFLCLLDPLDFPILKKKFIR